MDHCNSKLLSVTYGVLYLFTLLINYICYILSILNFSQFADDTNVFYPGKEVSKDYKHWIQKNACVVVIKVVKIEFKIAITFKRCISVLL